MFDDPQNQMSLSKREQRIGEILGFLASKVNTTVEELAETFGVSTMTIYRDLADLEADGLIVRNHGEISAVATTLVGLAARMRATQNTEVKTCLAKAALKYLRRSDSVMLDDSTTNLYLFPELDDFSPLTVITNSRFISNQVIQYPNLHLVSTGGNYTSWAEAYFETLTEQTIRSLHADVCIMSSSALSNGCCFHPDPLVAQTKKAMLQSSSCNILLVDHTKFLRTALHRVESLSKFQVVITNSLAPESCLENLRQMGVKVEIIG